jgi:hypothetical protein
MNLMEDLAVTCEQNLLYKEGFILFILAECLPFEPQIETNGLVM